MRKSISAIVTEWNGAQIMFEDGTSIGIDTDSIKTLKLAFPSECEACGFDPDQPMDYDSEPSWSPGRPAFDPNANDDLEDFYAS